MQLKTVAIYRLLYGADFIGESLASIYDHCDHILCFVGHEMFGGARVISYFGRDIYLPHDIDGVSDAIGAWKADHDPAGKIQLRLNPYATDLKNQVGRMINTEVIPNFDCTHVLFVEADEVWHERTIGELFDLASRTDDDEYMAAACHLFWRSYRYVSTRTNPYAVLRALKGRREIAPTGHALMSAGNDVRRRTDERIKIHNFGFAAAERTIFWKHMTALSFSRDRKLDSPPREEWFEDVWRPWNWHTNRRPDLCPSIGYEHAFPAAEEYPFDSLPAVMKDRIRTRPLPEWQASEAR